MRDFLLGEILMESVLLSRIEVLNLTKENFEEKCRGIQNLDTAVFKDICKRYGLSLIHI